MAGERDYDLQLKLLMLGDSAVGKSSLLNRYANGGFSTTHIATMGIEFQTKRVELDGRRLKLQLWDTAGQEKFRAITPSYFRGSQGIILCFDVTCRSSFETLKRWFEDIRAHAEKTVNVVLVGNKVDVAARERVVKEEEGRALAATLGVAYFETSARKNIGVDAAFEGLARQAAERLARERAERTGGGNNPAPVGPKGKTVDIKQPKPAQEGGGGKCAC